MDGGKVFLLLLLIFVTIVIGRYGVDGFKIWGKAKFTNRPGQIASPTTDPTVRQA